MGSISSRFVNDGSMNDTRHGVRLVLLLAIGSASVLSNGCFVLTSERRYKPEASSSEVKTLNDGNETTYSRFIDSEGFSSEIRVRNTPGTWDLAFLFLVLPFPVNYDYVVTQPLTVDVFVEPKSAQIAFDPAKTFFLSGKQDPLPSRRIFHNHDWFGANDSRSFPV